MQATISILMAQINPVVGAIAFNAKKMIDIIETHQATNDLIVFPELSLTGYPPEDLLLREEFYELVELELTNIKAHSKNCYIIVGHPTQDGHHRFNSLSVFYRGKQKAIYHKQHLPNYGVFDEQRYFTKGPARACLITVNNYRLGLCICEDIWQEGPVNQIQEAGADLLICINASPFDTLKLTLRESIIKTITARGLPVVYVNQVGGQDELVFDGQSLVFDATGTKKAHLPAFEEALHSITLEGNQIKGSISNILPPTALVYRALCLGLKDYVQKNNFKSVLLGLSGGIDSALTLCLAVDALGASAVEAIMMPSRFTAKMSIEDAKTQAELLGVQYHVLDIEPAYTTLLKTLDPVFVGSKPDVTEENLQARVRGVLLMAISNKKGSMLVTTSNKSETAVGYTTLYGDMAGGFAPLKDVLKTMVYELARYRNTKNPAIPERVLTRPPSAELRDNQTDQDSLPDYAVLDAIIKYYMEDNLSIEKIIAKGYQACDVLKVINLIQHNEYKRRQAAPGVKITQNAYGRDWRYPITSGFRLF